MIGYDLSRRAIEVLSSLRDAGFELEHPVGSPDPPLFKYFLIIRLAKSPQLLDKAEKKKKKSIRG